MNGDFISPLTGDRLTQGEAVLFNDSYVSTSMAEHDPNCYICRDPDFAQMGLPLCRTCKQCQKRTEPPRPGHVPADDTVCTVCGTDEHDTPEFHAYLEEQDAKAAAEREAGSGDPQTPEPEGSTAQERDASMSDVRTHEPEAQVGRPMCEMQHSDGDSMVENDTLPEHQIPGALYLNIRERVICLGATVMLETVKLQARGERPSPSNGAHVRVWSRRQIRKLLDQDPVLKGWEIVECRDQLVPEDVAKVLRRHFKSKTNRFRVADAQLAPPEGWNPPEEQVWSEHSPSREAVELLDSLFPPPSMRGPEMNDETQGGEETPATETHETTERSTEETTERTEAPAATPPAVEPEAGPQVDADTAPQPDEAPEPLPSTGERPAGDTAADEA